MPLTIIRNDITKMKIDAIVNAANTSLQAGGGVCGAIFNAAGADRLQQACNKLAPIQTGEAVITKGYALPAKYIIHAAGPVYHDGNRGEATLLRSCYRNALELAGKHKCASIAFPLISSGIYGYPKEEALKIATDTISKWLIENEMDVSLVVFDKTAFSISRKLLGDVKAFIDENYVDTRTLLYTRERSHPLPKGELRDIDAAKKSMESFYPEAIPTIAESPPYAAMSAPNVQLNDLVVKLDEPFSATLLRLIDVKGKTDVEVYKRANLDRKLFSKIRTGKGYMPGKKTVVALAVALELSLPETRDLMERAGFALSRSVVFDVIIEYFITRRKYDIFEINNVLFEYDQPLLGG